MSLRHPSRDRLVPVVAVASALAATAVSSASIVNGGFESPGTGYILVFAGQTVGDWTCVGSNVEYVHAAPNPALPGLEFPASEGSYRMDFGGVGGPSGIYQDITGLVAGQAYRVSSRRPATSGARTSSSPCRSRGTGPASARSHRCTAAATARTRTGRSGTST